VSDGSIYEIFKDESFVAYEIVHDMEMAEEFRDIYGMRFLGLEDPMSSTYYDYTFPNAEAPYPRDVVIDQNGIVRYWSNEFDPQKIIEVIALLLGGTSGTESPSPFSSVPVRLELAGANPFRDGVELQWSSSKSGATLSIVDASGRRIQNLGPFEKPGTHWLTWDGRDHEGRLVPAGVYFLQLRNEQARATRRVIRIN
jgi:hypothetical protein